MEEAIMQLAFEVRDLKEKECENSGKNWFDRFIYLTCKHEWHGQQVGGSPVEESSYEWVEFCKKCGSNKQED